MPKVRVMQKTGRPAVRSEVTSRRAALQALAEIAMDAEVPAEVRFKAALRVLDQDIADGAVAA